MTLVERRLSEKGIDRVQVTPINYPSEKKDIPFQGAKTLWSSGVHPNGKDRERRVLRIDFPGESEKVLGNTHSSTRSNETDEARKGSEKHKPLNPPLQNDAKGKGRAERGQRRM